MSELCKNDEFDAVGFKFTREELFEYALSAIKSHHLPGKPTFDMMTDVVANEMVSIIDMYLYMRGVNYASDIYDDADRNEYVFRDEVFDHLSEGDTFDFFYGEDCDWENHNA